MFVRSDLGGYAVGCGGLAFVGRLILGWSAFEIWLGCVTGGEVGEPLGEGLRLGSGHALLWGGV